MKKLLFAALLALAMPLSAAAQWYLGNKIPDFYHPYNIRLADTASVAEHPLDFQRMVVRLRFQPQEEKVLGQVTHHFKPLRPKVDSLMLHAPGIQVKSLTVNGKKASYRQTKNGLHIRCEPALQWETPGQLTIDYEATPRNGLYFIGWNSELRNQIWTQGQTNRHRHWVPMFDLNHDKLITETIVTFDEDYQVLSNGQLLETKSNGDGTKTWHYRISHPQSTYLMMLGIGKYNIEERKTASGLPLKLYYYPDQPEALEPTYRHSARMIDFFEETIQVPFPWESYAQIPVANFLAGAMENTTATLFGDFFQVGPRAYLDRNYIRVNAHELAHQWFGDLVTARTHRHNWLQESFATFYPGLFFRELKGEARYQWMRRQWQNAGLRKEHQDRMPIVNSRAGRTRIYPQGAAVLAMMMYTFGEKHYHQAVRHYLEENAYQTVQTRDLLNAFVDTLGINPDWFFEQWLYKGGIPHYQVDYQVLNQAGSGQQKTALVTMEQIQMRSLQTDFFKMPLTVDLYFQDGSKVRKRRMVKSPKATFRFSYDGSEKALAFVLFDPGSPIMKRVTFPKSLPELKRQGRLAEEMIDRYDALDAMADYPPEKTRDFLISRFEAEQFDELLARILKILGQDTAPAAQAFVAEQCSHPDADVRKAALASIDQIPEEHLPAYEKFLEDSSFHLIRSALQKLIYQYPEKADDYLQTVEGEIGKSKSVEIVRLGYQYHFHQDEQAAEKLAHYAGPDFEFVTRTRANSELRKQNYLSKQVMDNLVTALLSPSDDLYRPARKTLNFFKKQMKHRHQMANYYRSREWEDWQVPLVKPYFLVEH